MKYPPKVFLGEITVRDGLQHEEKTVSTKAKIWLANSLFFAVLRDWKSRTWVIPRACRSLRTRTRY